MSTKKLRKAAKEILHSANKIFHYRRDVTSAEHLAELDDAVEAVDMLYRDSDAKDAALQSAMDRLDALLRKIGGKMYPKTFWNDNIEVGLVAAIIVIGIRTFFFQPFIIPTNSMYPTYSGMNAFQYEDKNDAPNALEQGFRFVTLGAKHKSLVAQNSGEVILPMRPTQGGGMQMYFEPVKGKKFFILPKVLAEYTILVGGVPHKIQVPAEFDMQSALLDSFSGAKPELVRTQGGTGYALDLGIEAQAGQSILQFDITLGDALFVDRISYHFKRPEAGDPFVFRIRDIPGIEGNQAESVDKYYIKRIGGIGGEELEIRDDGTLLVNGEPRNEVEAFGRNARKEGEYGGYVYPNNNPRNPPKLLTEAGNKIHVPDGKYVALGDNSANSLDSRYWGYVPEKAVIGKAMFIYYPFTKRWGVAE